MEQILLLGPLHKLRRLQLALREPQIYFEDLTLCGIQSLVVVQRLSQGCVTWNQIGTARILEELGELHDLVGHVVLLVVLEPFHDLAVLPDALLDRAFVLFGVGARAVLLAIGPVAGVLFVVGPFENSESVLFVVEVFTRVLAAIQPFLDAHALHFVILPLALVVTAIRELVGTVSFHLIVFPVTCIAGAIGPFVDTKAIF